MQAALDAPRFCISAGSPETEGAGTGTSGDINSEVYFEEGIPEGVVQKLLGVSSWLYLSLWMLIFERWNISDGS